MDLLTRQRAALRLGISVASLDDLRRSGQIGYIQAGPGTKVWFRESDLSTFLARATHPPIPTPRYHTNKRS